MKKQPDLFLGIDSSTTACKAVLWDSRGIEVASGYSAQEVLVSGADRHEQSPETWWLAFTDATGQAMQEIDPGRVAALSMSVQRETFVPLDASGYPLANGILWMDERARCLMPDLEQNIDSDEFHRNTGKPLFSNLTFAKIAWLSRFEKSVFERTAMFADVHAYLAWKLTGEFVTSRGCADPTGLYDIERKQWSETLLYYLGIAPSQLPVIVPTGSVIGNISVKAARACGLPEYLPVIAGIGDGQAAGLGLNVTAPGDVYLSLGTSVVGGIFSEHYKTGIGFRTMTGGMPDSFLLETVLLGGAYTVSWFVEKMMGGPVPGKDKESILIELEKAASRLPAGSEGLLLLPHWNGALGPDPTACASGAVIGLKGIHGSAHFFRAILEGIAFEQRLYSESIEAVTGQCAKQYIVTGGGSRSDLWCQIIADVTGAGVIRVNYAEAAAKGAGMLAAQGTSWFSSLQETVVSMAGGYSDVFSPDSKRNNYYNCLYESVYKSFFSTIKPSITALAALSADDFPL